MSLRDVSLCLCIVLALRATGAEVARTGGKKPNTVMAVNATCTADSLTVAVHMRDGFQGLLYARGFPLECRAHGTGGKDVTLQLLSSGCGVRVQASEDGLSLSYVATVAVQLDRHLQQAADQQRTVTCRLPEDSLTLTSPALVLPPRPSARTARKQDISSADFHHSPSAARAWMEIKGTNSQGQVSVGEDTTLSIKAIIPEGFASRVTDCTAHDGAGESSQHLLDEEGCPIDELILPALIQHESSIADSSKLRLQVAETVFPAFKFPDRDSLHLRCTIQICRGKCGVSSCGSGRTSRNVRVSEIVERFQVFNSVEVLAPGIELDDYNPDESLNSVLAAPADADRAFCLSPPKMALAFGVLGLVFLCAVAVALYTLMRGRRQHYRSKLLLGEETLVVQDSPLVGAHRIQWPHIRILQ